MGQAPLLAPPVQSALDTSSGQFTQNRADMLEQLAVIDDLLEKAEAGGGASAMERMASRNKLPVRERIANVLDPDSPFLEASALAGYDSDYVVGGGMVVGIGVIAGTECVIMANDPSVLGGALTPYAGKKWMRALEIARDNRIPYVSFVDSAGADLQGFQTGGGGGLRAQTFHFAESGRFFYELSELSKMRIPTVCVTFGSSTAGGAYQPGLSDYNIVVREQSKIFLAGPPLVKMATGEDSDDETLGGAQMHAEVSGLGDYFAEDELDAIRLCRQVVGTSTGERRDPAQPRPRGSDARSGRPPRSREPRPPPALGCAGGHRPRRRRLAVRGIQAALNGSTIVCGWAAIHGYPVGIVGNNGVIYPRCSREGGPFHPTLQPGRHAPRLPAEHHRLHRGKGLRGGGDHQEGLADAERRVELDGAASHGLVIVGSSYGAGTYGMSAERSATASRSCGRRRRSP